MADFGWLLLRVAAVLAAIKATTTIWPVELDDLIQGIQNEALSHPGASVGDIGNLGKDAISSEIGKRVLVGTVSGLVVAEILVQALS